MVQESIPPGLPLPNENQHQDDGDRRMTNMPFKLYMKQMNGEIKQDIKFMIKSYAICDL